MIQIYNEWTQPWVQRLLDPLQQWLDEKLPVFVWYSTYDKMIARTVMLQDAMDRLRLKMELLERVIDNDVAELLEPRMMLEAAFDEFDSLERPERIFRVSLKLEPHFVAFDLRRDRQQETQVALESLRRHLITSFTKEIGPALERAKEGDHPHAIRNFDRRRGPVRPAWARADAAVA